MGLMFPRLARNFAKNGYYPTDEATIERALNALSPSNSMMRILDPCSGEGVAIAEVAHSLGRRNVQVYAVEYERERAEHTRTLVDRALQSDLMDTMITRQAFGLLWLNPPYGDLVSDHNGASMYQGKGRRRLEKLFYQRCLPLLQYGGVMVFIVPHYTLDDELCGWLSNHFSDLRIYAAPEQQFKQVVIFGVRTKRQDQDRAQQAVARGIFLSIGRGESLAEELPEIWPWSTYTVPHMTCELEHFYRVSLEPEQFMQEARRIKGLWSDFKLHFQHVGTAPRPPLRSLSQWHLALALAAGAISGVVTSKTGRVLVLKGDTHKEKTRKTEFTEQEDGSLTEVRILTDRFVPVIRAWDMTPGSINLGRVLTITSSATQDVEPTPPAALPELVIQEIFNTASFKAGHLALSRGIQSLIEDDGFDPLPYLRRHLSADWGELSDEDKRSNNQALKSGTRLFSGYDIDAAGEARLWIITEADRSVTTILFPSEY